MRERRQMSILHVTPSFHDFYDAWFEVDAAQTATCAGFFPKAR